MKIKLLVLVATMAALSARAHATTMVSMSMEQLTEASSDIVQARVAEQVSRWNSTHTQIETITTFEVSQTLKGQAPSTVQVRQLGGTVGNMTVTISGDIAFHPDSDYVLFLEPADGANLRVVGMSQGVYPVFQDARSQEARVVLPSSQAQVQNVVAGGGEPTGTVPLAAFHKYVATLVNAGVQIPHGLNIPISIAYTEPAGVGRVRVYGSTTEQMFPNQHVVIPAGTEVQGEAVLSAGSWTIRWDEMKVRGVHARISAVNHADVGVLRGKQLILSVR